MSEIINIPALFSAITTKVNSVLSTRAADPFPVYFDYGHYIEITRNLTEKGQAIDSKDKKYPLIWLVMDFVERFGSTDNYCELPDLQIIIATVTKPEVYTPDRMALNFIPRLYPIYQELLYQIEHSGYFSGIDFGIHHEKIDRPYWDGKDGQGGANMFNDFIDAIQLRKIRLTVNVSVCSKFRLMAA